MNYGQVVDNLPPPAATASLLKSTAIGKVRLSGADGAIIKALANTGIGIVIGAASGDIPTQAFDPNAAIQWVNSNVLPYYPASNITLITVGNEVVTSIDQGLISQLLPAMRNVQNALNSVSLDGSFNGRVDSVRSALVRVVQPGFPGRVEGLVAVPKGQWVSIFDQSLPFLCVPERFQA